MDSVCKPIDAEVISNQHIILLREMYSIRWDTFRWMYGYFGLLNCPFYDQGMWELKLFQENV
jgi:hypothetical protein